MAFSPQLPLTDNQSQSTLTVGREKTFGSAYGGTFVGGYQEVYSLSDLGYVIPTGTTGLIEYTGNTIPVEYRVKTVAFLPNTLGLGSDMYSSGRRRLGMLVYVIEEDATYQFRIPNYSTLFNNADDGSTITFDTYGLTVKDNTTAGANLIAAWTGSTIEGVDGVTRSNANWVKYHANAPEYVSINAVPASANITTWLQSNSINDAFVTIPQNWNGKQVMSVSGTYGDTNSASGATFTLEMRDSTNSSVSSVSWTHSGNNRVVNHTFTSPLSLLSGHTLNINYSVAPDSNAEGYCATFEIQS